ncbi:MAG: radical SAM protein [Elusimicrobia bacterium]|nr:radical SAM protein [Elusimicrobiota bacterium]
MFDRFDRRIDYLRVSVTDRCNLRCSYCTPERPVRRIAPESVLSFEEIAGFTACAAAMGIRKVRLTGGEPLMRRDLPVLVGMLAAVEGVADLSMTTNGVLLPRFAAALRAAGLRRVNVSLDSVDPAAYGEKTRGGDLRDALAGIEAARAAGLAPVKVNCVVKESPDEADARGVQRYCDERGLTARFIREMDMKSGRFAVVSGGSGGDCSRCNRLRLTSGGLLKPCLFSDLAFDIRAMGYREALAAAVGGKPEHGARSTTHQFYEIGG